MPVNAGDMGLIPGWGRPSGEGNSTWEIPWTEEPAGLQSMGHKELDMTLNNKKVYIKNSSVFSY